MANWNKTYKLRHGAKWMTLVPSFILPDIYHTWTRSGGYALLSNGEVK